MYQCERYVTIATSLSLLNSYTLRNYFGGLPRICTMPEAVVPGSQCLLVLDFQLTSKS